ncbi:purine-nucleoside phosphorylase [bacterium]|nr:purine-nucleoside phosphorylase [bacterium]
MRVTNDQELINTVSHVEDRIETQPRIGFILGSGLGIFADEVENPVVISTTELPDYPVSTVPGHAGRLVSGTIDGVPVLVVQGRVHYYEGYPIAKVAYPVRLLAALGCEAMVVTNASGGMGDHLEPGDLMLITDHINLMGVNPLVGQRWGFDTFPDMSRAYDPTLRGVVKDVAERESITLKEGVLGAWSGPTYETAAEVQLLKMIGVHAACMSTVPEVIAAARLRLPVVGVSCITNYATGISTTPLTHHEVTETAGRVADSFKRLLHQSTVAMSTVLPLSRFKMNE